MNRREPPFRLPSITNKNKFKIYLIKKSIQQSYKVFKMPFKYFQNKSIHKVRKKSN